MKRQTKFGIVLAAAAVISVSVASLVCARGWVQQGADWYYADASNEFVTETIQSSGNSKFYLDADGRMVRDYFLEDYNGNAYYFGSNGAMVTNTWVAIDSALVENQDDYVPDNYWYYFQASGKAMKGSNSSAKKTTIDGKKYAFNQYGQMCIGWFDELGKTVNPDDNDQNPFTDALYYAGGDNDGVLRAGWVTYYDGWSGDDSDFRIDKTNLYFYFNTANNKKTKGTTKKINGRTYAFAGDGVMMSGWDVYTDGPSQGLSVSQEDRAYFSGEDDGHQVKKGWVYTVPAQGIDAKAYDDDEEKYMYFNNSGAIVADQVKKINGKYYVFNPNGIMKTGVILMRTKGTGSKYIDKLDLDWATGEELAKYGRLNLGRVSDPDDQNNGEPKYIYVNPFGQYGSNARRDGQTSYPGESYTHVQDGDEIKLHLFGEDGARKTGMNTVEFSDDSFTLNTVGGSGHKGSGIFAKKYYSLGILLKASSDIRYGLYQTATESMLQPQDPDHGGYYYRDLVAEDPSKGSYVVLTTSGSKQKGNNAAKKDADGNYWMIGKSNSLLKGIYTVNIKENGSLTKFTTKTVNGIINNANPTTSDLATAFPELFVSDADLEFMGNVVWTVNDYKDGTSSYTLPGTYSGPVFQSDYGDKNTWIPFGVKDNAGKSATFRWTDCADEASTAYGVKPNNDYFLNCYWNEIK